jgi:hypothetical protein
MGGFLQGLGEFAGGVSEGISKEAVDRARREQAKAAKAERESKAEDREREDTAKTKIAGILGYKGPEFKPRVVEKTGRDKIAGVLAGLLGKKEVDKDAIVAGVKPPPVLPVGVAPLAAAAAAPAPVAAAVRAPVEEALTPIEPLGPRPAAMGPEPAKVGLGTDAAAPAAPAAAPAPAGPPGYKPPSEVPVFGTGGQETRPANDIDQRLRLAQAYFEAGDTANGIKAHQEYSSMVAARKLALIPSMRTSDLATLWQEGTGRRPTISKANGLWTITDGGEEVLKDATDGDVQAAIGNHLSQDPAAVAAIANASNEGRTKRLELQPKIDALQATAAAARANAVSTLATADQTGVETQDLKSKALRANKFWEGSQKYKSRGSSLLDPAGHAEYARDGEFVDPEHVMVKTVGKDAEGNPTSKTSNVLMDRQQSEREEFLGDPHVQNKLLRMVPQTVSEKFPFGRGFLVPSAKGPAFDRVYPDLDSAMEATKTAYPDPVAGGKAVAAAAAAARATPPPTSATPKTEPKRKTGGVLDVLKHGAERPKDDPARFGKSALNLILPRDKQLKIKKRQ